MGGCYCEHIAHEVGSVFKQGAACQLLQLGNRYVKVVPLSVAAVVAEYRCARCGVADNEHSVANGHGL